MSRFGVPDRSGVRLSAPQQHHSARSKELPPETGRADWCLDGSAQQVASSQWVKKKKKRFHSSSLLCREAVEQTESLDCKNSSEQPEAEHGFANVAEGRTANRRLWSLRNWNSLEEHYALGKTQSISRLDPKVPAELGTGSDWPTDTSTASTRVSKRHGQRHESNQSCGLAFAGP